MVRWGMYVVIGYLALCVVMFLFQRRLLYIPSRHALSPRAIPQELRLWPVATENYLGFLKEAQTQDVKGTVVVFHGNAGSARDRTYFSDALGELGYRVILAEYPGFGARPGQPTQATLVEQAVNLTQQVKATFPGPVYLWGESLGAGVVAAAAATGPQVDGIVLLTPWDSLTAVAQSLYWYLPVRLLIKDRFESTTYLSQFSGPVAVVLAEKDEIIPIRHGNRLFDSIQSPKKRWVFPGAGHNSWPAHQGADWWQEVMAFVQNPNSVQPHSAEAINP